MDCVHLERLPRTVQLGRAADGSVEFVYVDERLLPGELRFERTGEWQRVVDAVKTLAVRGAPAIGFSGGAALALWAGNEGAAHACAHGCAEEASRFLEELHGVAVEVAAARPTAVNLAWGVSRVARVMRQVVAEGGDARAAADAAYDEVSRMGKLDEAVNRAIGRAGAELVPERAGGARILTHCNAGSLATVFFGTALGVVYAAAEEGRVARVYVDETRPVGQGARLTAWELARAGVPATVICDNMAASLMAAGKVDMVVVGADRIAANGDVANKIGTYGVAVLARHHGIPFYVAAPASTFDASIQTGADIPIEERSASEVMPCAIAGVEVWNPAFDVTPANLVSAIVTEYGAFPPERAAAEVTRRQVDLEQA